MESARRSSMLPDDDMLKAFVADTMMKEEEQASLNTSASAAGASEKSHAVNTPDPIETMASSRLPGTRPVLGPIVKWGLLILAVMIAWFVLSKQ
jgi:hypothetical protein